MGDSDITISTTPKIGSTDTWNLEEIRRKTLALIDETVRDETFLKNYIISLHCGLLERRQIAQHANRNKTYFCSLFLEFFDCSLVNPTAFVDQVASSSGLAGVYVSDNDDVEVNLFLSHYVGCEEIFATRCSWKESENHERKNVVLT